jgi:thiamine biosynthesis lipoprotein
LVALTAAAVLVPWGARRQIYCHHLCPHGAAQEWLGRLSRRNISLPKAAHDTLRILPGILLAAGFLCALRLPLFPIGNLEPFDFWILGRAAVVPAVLAFLGLGLSVFVPMAYCRYGCPTGALLSFVRSASSRELFGKRDAFAALVLLSAWLLTPSNPRPLPGEHVEAMRGTGFGTTWCVKLRGEPAVHEQLHASLTAEVRRIEATLSHWSKDSATSRFNASTSTEEQPIPQELGKLVNFALRLHRKTAGAYDITVSSLVSAWGYGPAGETSTVPSDAHLQTLLAMVGSEKLTLNPNGTGLRKSHSAVTLDLGSLLQGYAVDRLCALLDAGGLTNYLVEVGGELRSRGAWRVALENPGKPNSPLKIVTLKDSALATSGLPRARRRLEGQMVSHIISPKTGRPVAPTIEACSVQHSTCLEADGWATAVIASGLPAADALAKRESLAVWVLDATGVFKRLE